MSSEGTNMRRAGLPLATAYNFRVMEKQKTSTELREKILPVDQQIILLQNNKTPKRKLQQHK